MENTDHGYKKKNPFSVPDSYFDQLTDRVMQRTGKKEVKKKASFGVLVRPYIGLAAIFAGVLFMVQVILPRFMDQDRMLLKEGETITAESRQAEEDCFDTGFNPTKEEILEYLSSEMDEYELLYADLN